MSSIDSPAYPQEQGASGATVCVSGATGFLAGNVTARLLALGCIVHGTCRDPAKAKDLQALPGAAERLKLFKADLVTPGSFDEALTGCQYLIHCASPYVNGVPNNQVQEKLLKPAIGGVENILASVNKTPSIKRVVLTSSCAAVYGRSDERKRGHIFTEEDWCITPTEAVLPYFYSKREAEKKAWEINKAQDKWQLVVINPPGIFGPPKTGRPDGESVGIVKQILGGMMYPACPYMGVGIVDVRDVAAAHTLALFHPDAKGRYICCNGSYTVAEMCKMLGEAYPARVKAPFLTVPKALLFLIGPLVGLNYDTVMNVVGLAPPVFSSDKIKKELGFSFKFEPKTSFADMAQSLSDMGMVKKL